jgi:hypothetical protein
MSRRRDDIIRDLRDRLQDDDPPLVFIRDRTGGIATEIPTWSPPDQPFLILGGSEKARERARKRGLKILAAEAALVRTIIGEIAADVTAGLMASPPDRAAICAEIARRRAHARRQP